MTTFVCRTLLVFEVLLWIAGGIVGTVQAGPQVWLACAPMAALFAWVARAFWTL